MKLKINNYVFDASAKTIEIVDYATIRLDSILLISNVTRNIIIYNFASVLKGGTVSSNVLSLTYDTSSMSDSDKLLIYYDEAAALPALESGGNLEDIKTNVDAKLSDTNSILGDIKTAAQLAATQATLASALLRLANMQSDLDYLKTEMDAAVSTRASESTMAAFKVLFSKAQDGSFYLKSSVQNWPTGFNVNNLPTGWKVVFSGNQPVKIMDSTGTYYLPSMDSSARPGFVKTVIAGRNVSYRDTSFVVGDSPVTLDVNNDLGRNGCKGWILNEGPGDIQVEISDNNGTNYGGAIIIHSADVLSLDGWDVDRIKITWIANSAYQVVCL